jgi:FSR family fosmidomycin resistance protein-like MFS transporter
LKPLAAVWKPMAILYTLVFIRSILQVTFAQLLPLYLHLERGFSVTNANYTLSAYLAAGAMGGLAGGHLTDRWGGRTVILISMLSCIPFLALFFWATGPLAVAGLVLGGVALLFTVPVNVVMAQELAPGQAGTVSALMMGFAWGSAGLIFIPLTGWAGDHIGMHRALASLLVFPIVGALLTLKLPRR